MFDGVCGAAVATINTLANKSSKTGGLKGMSDAIGGYGNIGVKVNGINGVISTFGGLGAIRDMRYQRIGDIKNADQILVLDDGRIAEQGNHETLMAKDGIYSKLYKSQFDALS